MTPKQLKFCQEYVASGNATEAAIKAGYSKKTARFIGAENLTKPYIKSYIDDLNQKIESEKIATAAEMQQILTSIIRQELKEETIIVEGSGDGYSEGRIMDKKPSHKDVINAIDKLCRMQGVYDNSANISVMVPVFTGEGNLED